MIETREAGEEAGEGAGEESEKESEKGPERHLNRSARSGRWTSSNMIHCTVAPGSEF